MSYNTVGHVEVTFFNYFSLYHVSAHIIISAHIYNMSTTNHRW